MPFRDSFRAADSGPLSEVTGNKEPKRLFFGAADDTPRIARLQRGVSSNVYANPGMFVLVALSVAGT